MAATNTPSAIPWNQIGAKAGADYKGDGLAVTLTESGARLRCVFQRLDGEATPEGLWLTSTVTNTVSDRFRVTAMEIGRRSANAGFDSQGPEFNLQLAAEGTVSVEGQKARFVRPGLTEEYTVSMDGVRQDFIVEVSPGRGEHREPVTSCPSPILPFLITSKPTPGQLVLKLAVTGAQVEATAYGARLVLNHSGRKIAYSRLRVTDATGKELPARIEVSPAEDQSASFASWSDPGDPFEDPSLLTPEPAREELAVVVNDAEAVYPVRIDPTFSDADWVSMAGVPGTDGQVNAAVTDGSGNLYIGGTFEVAGNAIASNIAEWNGSSWSALGSGISGGGVYFTSVYALAVSGSTLYAGGVFTSAGGSAANYIAQWNGSSWSALGSGIAGGYENGTSVYALAVSGGTLYAGGDFTTAGGIAVNYVAQWNGSTSNWSALGSGMNPLGSVYALAVSGSTLFAGGDFTTAGGTAVGYIAQWNGSSWSDVGSGMDGDVIALAVSGSTLYAGGYFSLAGGNAATNIAQWNGSTSNWSALGSGISGIGANGYAPTVCALAVSGNTLYAGGDFTTAGGSAVNNIAQWNGSSWSALGSGISGGGIFGASVYALAVSDSTLYAGGFFTSAGGSAANYIAQWNGSNWSALGSGMNTAVFALAVSGSTLYAGGGFATAGGSAANYIAQWNGSSWSSIDSGMNGPVSALAVSGSALYAGGSFSTAGGTAANNIAQWNGSNWSALGSGISGGTGNGLSVNALAVSGGTLYVGGDFTTAGASAAKYIAAWNGSTCNWSPLGSGMNGPVNALAVSGSTLYAGGDFSAPGNYIAAWNGSTSNWSALGAGMYNSVYALAVSGSTLYAGGDFTTAGTHAANYIAQWNGSRWSALGSGMDSDVYALAVSGTTLYAGGQFVTAGGSAASYIAQWNGSSWSALGSGMNNEVLALAASGGTLYAGGYFDTAGTNVSAYAAEANLAGKPVSLGINTTDANFGFTNGVFGFDVSGPSGSNVVIQASADLKTWVPLQTNLLNNGLLYFSDSQAPANRQRFYRAVLSP